MLVNTNVWIPIDTTAEHFDVSIVTCLCPTREKVTNMTGDDTIAINCILQGYQTTPHDFTTVVIRVNNETVMGNVRNNYLNTTIRAIKLYTDLTLEFYLNHDFPHMIQCRVPRLNPCSYNTSTTTFELSTTTLLQMQTLNINDVRNHYSSPTATTGYDNAQHHTPSSSTIRVDNIVKHQSLPSATTTGAESRQYHMSSPSRTGTGNLTNTSTSSSIKEFIWIVAIAGAVVLIIALIIVSTVCVIFRRNRRNTALRHKPCCTEKLRTKQPATRTHVALNIAPIDQTGGTISPDQNTENVSSEMTLPTGYAHHSNEAPINEEDSMIDMAWNTIYEPSTGPASLEPANTAHINKDAGPSANSPISLPVIKESGTSCIQYESVDFIGGSAGGVDERVVEQPTRHQRKVLQEPTNTCSQYECVDFPPASGRACINIKGDAILYAVPDKCPKSPKGTLEEQSSGHIGDVPLYAMPDKTLRSGRASSGNQSSADLAIEDISILYAQVDKHPK